MRRLHLLEIEDQPWCPAPLRDAATDFLQHVIQVGDAYAPAGPRLRALLAATGARRIVDLCSGGGGPWMRLLPALRSADGALEVVLTDKFPNEEAMRRARARSGGALRFEAAPVDATCLPREMEGVRTLFSAFHHFRPEQARAILADAVRQRQPIAVFEATERSVRGAGAILASPLLVLALTPWIRPFRWSRLFFTYLVPLVPLLVLFDGLVSSFRTYSPGELRRLVAGLGETGYRWEIGQDRSPGAPAPVTYLIGYPEEARGPEARALAGDQAARV